MSVLFVGNGPNRCANLTEGWNSLFETAVNVPGFAVQNSLSLTLEFELNVCNLLAQAKSSSGSDIKNEDDIKRKIAAYIEGKQKDAPAGWAEVLHRSLLDISPDTILTTNYDYFLELALDSGFTPDRSRNRETTYSLKRFQQAGSKRVYHIHGEISRPKSICLGFEQYSGSLQRIRSELLLSTGNLGDGRRFHLWDVLNDLSTPEENRWHYSFFNEDVYILGLRLDAAELDIWWLLNYRAKLMREYPGLVHNRIVYFETDSPANATEKKQLQQKRTLLEAFGVEVLDCTSPRDGGSYEKRYAKALRLLREERKKEATRA